MRRPLGENKAVLAASTTHSIANWLSICTWVDLVALAVTRHLWPLEFPNSLQFGLKFYLLSGFRSRVLMIAVPVPHLNMI